ncbi:MAG: succinylglutamate desuccinylase/aspartoacylase family protein [candidate division Zixibacteria bacterium]|nr:succinylglutamate desuccinylase/aspartoacylase family protein [candidate division Zixibacteria bacterium]
MKRIAIFLVPVLFLLTLGTQALASEIYFKFKIDSPSELAELTKIISIDNVIADEVFAYANDAEWAMFLEKGYDYEILPHPGTLLEEPNMSYDRDGMRDWDAYPTFEAYEAMMYAFASDHPSLCRIVNAGYSVEGRAILFAVISDNVNTEEDEPEVMYTGTMHGDETTGYIMILRMIDSLLTAYGTDSLVTRLVDSCEIWMNPLANPDGTYAGGNSSVSGATRYNANSIDINRNFPDFEEGDHPDGNAWQDETVVMMNLAAAQSFVISANYHGGAEVFNYPWDTWSIRHADDNWWYDVGRDFADTAHIYSPSGYMTFKDDGVTNGYDWYTISGGRQDYMNYFHHCREVTLEISDTKLLPASQLPAFWGYLRSSMFNYLEMALYGVRGIVTDQSTGDPLYALIEVIGHDKDSSQVVTDPDIGNYHRMIEAGTWDLVYSAPGYYPDTVTNVVVTDYNTVVVDIQLEALPILPDMAFDSYTSDFPDPGETIDLSITLTNNGMGNATGLSGVLSTGDSYVTVTQPNSAYPTISAQGGTGTSLSQYQYVVSAACPAYHQVNFTLALTGDEGYSKNLYFSVTIGQLIETYESGDFNAFEWDMAGDLPWTITDINPYQGVYCAKSGGITHNDSSQMSITLEVTDPGTISFAYKVSSESGWDYLRFYIDNTLKNQWSGEIGWSLAAYQVAAGTHTFKWRYIKDGSFSSGSDCGWIDAVAFPPVNTGSTPVQIVTSSLPNWTAGVAYSQQLVATGGDGPLSWADKNANLSGTGLTLSLEGLLSGTPTGAGPISFTAQVSDTLGSTDEKPYNFNINAPVSITPATLPAITVGIAYSQQLAATGGTGALSWTDKNGDLTGTGLTMNAAGLVSGTPTSDGTLNFTAHAEDQPGGFDEEAFAITVNPAVAITTVDLPEAIQGEVYSYQLTATGGTGTLTWNDKNNDLNGKGLTLSSTGLLSGTPTGSDNITFWGTVADALGSSAERQFTLSVSASYICGDVNDDLAINLLDILYLISYIYGTPQGPAPDPMESGDVNDGDGSVNLLDILYLIDYIYGTPQGPAPSCP